MAHQCEVPPPRQIADWMRLLLEWVANVLGAASAPVAPMGSLKELCAEIGQTTVEKYFLIGALSKARLLGDK